MYIFMYTFEENPSLVPACMEMRTRCETCGQSLPPEGIAYICSYECTYCPTCAQQHESRCPNCQGELVRRPRRITSSADHDKQA